MDSKQKNKLTKVGILIADQFIMLNLDIVIDTLRIANRILEKPEFEWQIFTANNYPVSSCNGFIVQSDIDWEEAKALDYLLVITGFDIDQNIRKPVMQWLKALHQKGAGLGCIDTGAFTLAAADVLSPNQTVAIHWELEEQFRKQYPNLKINTEGISCGGNFFSACGGLSVAEMMLQLLSRNISSEKVNEVKHILYSHGSKEISAKDYVVPNNPVSRIERAEQYMHSTLSSPLSLNNLANMNNMHPRTFTRHFKQSFGMTPMKYYRKLRLEHAHNLLSETTWPISRIADMCGFSEVSNFSACFSGHYGVPPFQLRNNSLNNELKDV